MTPREAIRDVLRRECGVSAEVHDDTRLVEDLGLDSVRLLTLAAELENRFQVVLGEDPNHPPRTLGEVAELLERRLA
ncbi:MAG: acyl carrier protein [Candidatus Eremiobacterota bacterium]